MSTGVQLQVPKASSKAPKEDEDPLAATMAKKFLGPRLNPEWLAECSLSRYQAEVEAATKTTRQYSSDEMFRLESDSQRA